MAPIGGVYEGAAGIRRFLMDIEDAGPDFRIEIQRLRSIGTDRVVAFVCVRSTGRASGISTVADSTNVYDFADGRIKRIRVFFDREEALKAVGLGE
jgi:ketosteroid isomerase-like protein